jgi:C-terminal processing protease CtpA/Prc
MAATVKIMRPFEMAHPKVWVLLALLLGCVVGLGQQISGIGVALRKTGDDLIVNAVLPDSPAAASKAIHRGDRIIAIADGDGAPVQVTGLGLAEVVGLIRGPKGTSIRVTIAPQGKDDPEAQVIKLVRGELKGVTQAVDVPFDDGFGLWLWLVSLGVRLAHP